MKMGGRLRREVRVDSPAKMRENDSRSLFYDGRVMGDDSTTTSTVGTKYKLNTFRGILPLNNVCTSKR